MISYKEFNPRGVTWTKERFKAEVPNDLTYEQAVELMQKIYGMDVCDKCSNTRKYALKLFNKLRKHFEDE